MGFKRIELDNIEQLIMNRGKKFVRYDEGAKLYSLGIQTFMQLAKDAGATYRIKRAVLVNTEIIDEYLENFRENLPE